MSDVMSFTKGVAQYGETAVGKGTGGQEIRRLPLLESLNLGGCGDRELQRCR